MRVASRNVPAVVALAAILWACGETTVVSGGSPGEAVAIEVSPALATLEALGASVQFNARALDGSGVEVPSTSVTWVASDPAVASVDSEGRAVSLTNGATGIKATMGSIEGDGELVVTQVPSSVQLAPSAATLGVGETLQSDAVVVDARGHSVPDVEVTWSTSNESVATVDGDGLVTAVDLGTAEISARNGEARGDMAVSVNGSMPPPSGTILFEEGFEDDDLAARGWYDFGAWDVTTSEAHSGGGSLELAYSQGAQQSTGGGGRHLFDETESLYISYWVKYSANWIGSGQPYNPHEFQVLTNRDDIYSGPAWTHLTMYLEHVHAPGGNVPAIRAADRRNIDQANVDEDLTGITEERAAHGCNGSSDGHDVACWFVGGGTYWNEKSWTADQPYFLDAPGPGYKNDWHFVEAYFELNSIQSGVGQTDGVVQYWFDGQLILDHHDVLLRTGANPTLGFNQLIVGPWISDGSPISQTWWLDDLTVATARPVS